MKVYLVTYGLAGDVLGIFRTELAAEEAANEFRQEWALESAHTARYDTFIEEYEVIG